MKKNILTLFLLFSLISCNNEKTESQEKQEKKTETINNYVETYEGNIGGKYGIMMKLISNNGSIDGSYFYKKNGIKIDIKGNLKSDSLIILKEFDNNGNQTGIFNGKILDKSKIIGKWSKPNGKNEMDFLLIETNSNYETTLKNFKNRDYNYITGKYESPFNGSGVSSGDVKIKYLGKNKFSFEIEVVSNYGNSIGEIKEVGKIINGIGYFTKRDCKLIFKFKGKELYITQKGCVDYSGMSSFGGKYLKK